jgi:hypothetical protein
MGANHDGPQMVTTYSQFIRMKPPTFTKAEEPLDADAWVRAIEAKFSAFVLPCSEERKAIFATLQLRGEALKCGGSTLSPCNLLDMKLLGLNSSKLSRITTSQRTHG